MYGKLIDGVLHEAPRILRASGKVYYNPTDELYREMGYLPIVETPYPEAEEGEQPKEYISEWREENGEILQIWVEAEPAEENSEEAKPMTLEERLCQAETELAVKKEKTERMNADLVYLCMMNDIEPVSEVSI